MPRTSKVTFTASAVTLACLAGALYASPLVLAETMGREVQAFSPMDFTDRRASTLEAGDTAATSRDESTLTNDGSWNVVQAETSTSRPSDTEMSPQRSDIEVATTTDDAESDDEPATAPTDAATQRITSELPQIDVTLPPSSEPSPDESESPTPDSETTEDTSDEDVIPEDVDSPDSITVIVNKLRGLPSDYAPDDLVELETNAAEGTHRLREEAAEATEALFAAAAEDGIDLTVISSYRSYAYQQELYDNYVSQYGSEHTNEMSARPGHSEHQTGLALDVDTPGGEHSLSTSFGDTEAGQWVADHAHEYGFVIRYPQDQDDITGFSYEPWHLRYFGEQFATQIAEHSGVAEEEFGLEPAPDYDDDTPRE